MVKSICCATMGIRVWILAPIQKVSHSSMPSTQCCGGWRREACWYLPAVSLAEKSKIHVQAETPTQMNKAEGDRGDIGDLPLTHIHTHTRTRTHTHTQMHVHVQTSMHICTHTACTWYQRSTHLREVVLGDTRSRGNQSWGVVLMVPVLGGGWECHWKHQERMLPGKAK